MPFIKIKLPHGTQVKLLIDTGSNKNFISPKIIPEIERKPCKPMAISNTKGNHKCKQKYLADIFNTNEPITFYLFKFHKFFDGILGYETLSSLKASIDVSNNKIVLPNKSIEFEIKKYGPPEITINAHSSMMLKIPVCQQNGNAFLKQNIKISEIIIPAGLYQANNGYINALASNFGETTTFTWTRPAKTLPIEKMLEINNTNLIKSKKKLFHAQYTDLESLIRTKHLNTEEKYQLLQVLKKNLKIIQKPEEKLSCTTSARHKIQTVDDIPVHTRTYRYPHIHKPEVEKQINEMLADGIIQNSISPWTSPIWIVPKKADASGKKKWRIVVDYRKLNDKTIDDKFPIPNMDEILDKLGRSVYFTTLDLKSGFHQIEVDPKDRAKTAFSTEKGHFEFIRMPFGLKNAPATFQRAMNCILSDLIGKCCLVYLDDIIIFGSSLQQHLDNLNKVLKRLIEANLKVQLDKCEFLQKQCEFLGHIVTENGIKPNPNKIEKILSWPLPKTAKQIKGFLGLLGYYRKFIKDFAKLTKPLTRCLKKDAKIIHNEEFKNCFNDCKQLLTSDPILRYPNFEKSFILETDASDFALGAVLSQKFEDAKEHPIAYASRTLNDTECNWSATEKELAAIVWAVKHFRPYIYGTKFQLRTDHKALVWLRQKKDLNRKLLNMKLELEEYEFEVVYKKGTLNRNADALSRIECEISDNAEIHAIDEDFNRKLLNIKLDQEEYKNEFKNNNDNKAEIHANSNESTMTQHSADTDAGEFIPCTLKPLNEFRNQIILEQSPDECIESTRIFPNHLRIKIRKTIFSPAVLINILKEYASLTCVNGLYCSTSILNNMNIIYKNFFSRAKTFRIFWTQNFLTDVTDEPEQEQIIQTQHNNNHRGIVETTKHISTQYYFPKLRAKVTRFINLCKLCQKSKYERHPYKPKFKFTETPAKPLEIVHMDIFIINRKNYLTFCDKFSRLAVAIPIRTRNAVHIIQAVTKFIALLGKPSLLVTDSETSFTSTSMREFLEENLIEYHFTCLGQSSSNGTVEIVHRTLRELHNILSNKESTKDMSESTKINLAVTIYNDSIHSHTNITPKELFYGIRNKDVPPEDLDERIRLKEKLFSEYKERELVRKQSQNEKLNRDRENHVTLAPGDTMYERKRNNLKHQERYNEIKVKENMDVSIRDENERKIHKTKLKRKRNT